MSAILLNNPFVPITPAAQPSETTPQTALAVAPTKDATAGQGAGDSTSFSGQGDRQNDKSVIDAFLASAREEESSANLTQDAQADSVVTAQTHLNQPDEVDPLESKLPKVELPYIIPTAHWFLKEDN